MDELVRGTDNRSLDGKVDGIAIGRQESADEGVTDGLDLDTNYGSLDGEVDGIAVGTLLGTNEGAVYNIVFGNEDGSLDGAVYGAVEYFKDGTTLTNDGILDGNAWN